MPLNLNSTGRLDDSDGFHGASTAAVWRWTPLTAVGFLALAGIITQLPLNSFFAVITIMFSLIVTGLLAALCMVLFRSCIGSAILTLSIGLGFAVPGATIAWWLYYAILDPAQQNKAELGIVMGFASLALLSVGSSTVTAVLLGLLEGNGPDSPDRADIHEIQPNNSTVNPVSQDNRRGAKHTETDA